MPDTNQPRAVRKPPVRSQRRLPRSVMSSSFRRTLRPAGSSRDSARLFSLRTDYTAARRPAQGVREVSNGDLMRLNTNLNHRFRVSGKTFILSGSHETVCNALGGISIRIPVKSKDPPVKPGAFHRPGKALFYQLRLNGVITIVTR